MKLVKDFIQFLLFLNLIASKIYFLFSSNFKYKSNFHFLINRINFIQK